jgi:hypothetical protein
MKVHAVRTLLTVLRVELSGKKSGLVFYQDEPRSLLGHFDECTLLNAAQVVKNSLRSKFQLKANSIAKRSGAT